MTTAEMPTDPNAPTPRVAILVARTKEDRFDTGMPVAGLPTSPQEWLSKLGSGVDYSAQELTYLFDNLEWGGYGIDGKQPLSYTPFRQLTVDHIQNILLTQSRLQIEIKTALLRLLVEKLTQGTLVAYGTINGNTQETWTPQTTSKWADGREETVQSFVTTDYDTANHVASQPMNGRVVKITLAVIKIEDA